jgi:hypothetical protein
VELSLGSAVTSLDPATRTVTTATSARLHYDKLHEQRIQAGMNINIWDVADDIERLITSARQINADDLADPAIPLTSLF